MFKSIKKGFGFGIGFTLGKALLGVVCTRVSLQAANDEKYMNRVRTDRPDLYESLKKYQKPKEEKEE